MISLIASSLRGGLMALGLVSMPVFAGLLAALVGILLGRRIARARLIPRAPVREEDEA